MYKYTYMIYMYAYESVYILNGFLTKYAQLRVAYAPEMPGTFSMPLSSKETASYRSLHASRHMRNARTMRDSCRGRHPAVAGKTFPAFPAHVHPIFFTYLAHVVQARLTVFNSIAHNNPGKVVHSPPRLPCGFSHCTWIPIPLRLELPSTARDGNPMLFHISFCHACRWRA